jgi:Zn-dependent protease with chaperone function
MRHAFATMAILLASLAAGCASTKQARLQEAIRKAAHGKPVAETRGDVAVIFRELAQSGGVDPQSLYVAVQKSETLNAAAVGHHHFLVTRGALGLDDRCFLTGLVAHELAHDILEHPEMAAKTSDVTSTVSTVLGVAASAVVPGAGYLVQGAAGLGLRAYSRSQEAEADALAIKILRDAGKPEWSLRYALERLRDQSGSGGGWLSTHPAIEDRIAAQPPMDAATVRAACGWAPGDPPAWCRGERDRYNAATGACSTLGE